MCKKIWLVLGAAAVCLAVASGCERRDELALGDASLLAAREPALSERAGSGTEEVTESEDAAKEAESAREAEWCYVHICGEVEKPGVYRVEADTRVYQVIELAGGLTEEACPDYVNQAAVVGDGMKLVIPSQEEALTLPDTGEEPDAGKGPDGAVNINTASREELCTLNGIGEGRAESIIKYREEHGGFSRIEDIMKVEGIKDGAFSKIKDKITVR